MPIATTYGRAANAAANATCTSIFADNNPLVWAHSRAANDHLDATREAANGEIAHAHCVAAEAHENAAADQAAWIHSGDPDGAPGTTARSSARAWLLSAEAYELEEVGR